jgi:hypothetical protein
VEDIPVWRESGGGSVLSKEGRRRDECNLFISHGRARETESNALN